MIFLGLIAVGVVFCGVVPFVVMPGMGYGMALPVITVPGETLTDSFLGTGLPLTNTIVGTLLADVVVLLFAFGATRKMKEVPGRLQGLFEVLTDALYNLVKTTAGAKNAAKLFPLVATLFIFLLTANWLELVPGVDSVGMMHCAEAGFSGYERDGVTLYVPKAMDSGVRATEENYEACHAAEAGHTDPTLEAAREAAITAAAAELGVETVDWKADVGNSNTLADYITAQGGDPEAVYQAAIEALGNAEGEAAHEEGATEGENAAEGEHAAMSPEDALQKALYEPFWRDDIFVVTSFVRAATTDLNLTLGLALLAVIVIQIFGVQALGVKYFAKFINTPALEDAGKNPMGVMDFGIGLLEIVSELSKVLSFGFRLFGNIFAGQVLLFVIPFLIAWIVPTAVYGLELFVGLIQAFVFAMLLLVFSAMAMEGHGHEEDAHH